MQNMQRAYFDYDRTELRSDARSAVDGNVSMLTSNSDIKIEVQGHADERGTTQYNMALGQRRANQVVRYMTNNGISSTRLRAVSYGEERPLSSGSDESSHSQNRRAEFKITFGGTSYTQGTTQ
jgi:peptidoglycan-associated lipoprotein